MNTIILTPHKALQPYIQYYVFCELGKAGNWSQTDMVPPGCTSLSITAEGKDTYIGENGNQAVKYECITFVGQTTSFKKIVLYDRLKSFFVIFRPCGAYQLLGVHQGDCRNNCVNLTDILGSQAAYFEDEVSQQITAIDIRSVVEQFFLKRVNQNTDRFNSIHLAQVIDYIRLNSCKKSLIKKVCRQQGYSISRLERHMRRIVGLSPKQYQRIMRFNAVLKFINNIQLPYNWSQIAQRFGYFDQTHFINEFKLFYGMTPAEYASNQNYLSDIAFLNDRSKPANAL